MNYWLHRCKYEGGLDILDKEHRLTIGYAACANNTAMVKAITEKDGAFFDEAYRNVYGGEYWRGRYSLWYFGCEFVEGDVVVVPRDGGFSICQLKGQVLVSDKRSSADIGFEWEVETFASCEPRDAYASASLLSRMKCRQTTLNISDLEEDVEEALKRYRENSPFSLVQEMSKKCHDVLDQQVSPYQFECMIRDYFVKNGASAEVLSKNYSDKEGDCDVEAVFPALRLTIFVQAKKHIGETGDWAVRQIVDYNKSRCKRENWTYANWVVTLASDFTAEAKALAKEHGIVLINGEQCCRMLLSKGFEAFN